LFAIRPPPQSLGASNPETAGARVPEPSANCPIVRRDVSTARSRLHLTGQKAMAWPYQFLDLSAAEKHERRLSLDRHAAYSQLSALAPVAVLLLFRFGSWVLSRASASKVAYDAVPSSPAAKYKRENGPSSWAATARKVAWWLGDDVVFARQNWGRRDTLVFGSAYALWLLFLCVQGTGRGECNSSFACCRWELLIWSAGSDHSHPFFLARSADLGQIISTWPSDLLLSLQLSFQSSICWLSNILTHLRMRFALLMKKLTAGIECLGALSTCSSVSTRRFISTITSRLVC
jgi:hypothetical protein